MENKRIMKWFSMLLLMMVASISGATAQSLSLESFDIKAGGTDEVAIQLVAENPIYGIQTDIVLSEGLSLDKPTTAVRGMEINSNQVGNITRVSLLSVNGDEIPAGSVINLKVTAAAGFQRGTITLTNTRLTIDNKGNEQRADDVTAYVTLEQEMNTYTATFTTNAGWTDVYAYAWSGKEGEEGFKKYLGDWPGTKLEAFNGVHVVTITATEAPEKIIFNNGAGIQTEDIPFEDGMVYEYTAPQPTKYTITVAADIVNGTVTADKVEAEAGEKVSLIITPAEGYELERLAVVDAGGNIVQVAEDYTFTMPAANVMISASFKKAGQPVEPKTYTATFINNGNWAVVNAYAWAIKNGTAIELLGGWPGTTLEASDKGYVVTITATEAPAFIIFNNGAGIQTEDIPFEDGMVYEYTAPQPTKYTITVAADIANGTVTADKTEAEAGEKVSLIITPAEGYELERLAVVDAGGNIVQVAEDYTFTMPAANVMISASFKEAEQPVEPTTFTATFTTNAGWEKVYAYAWSGDGETAVKFLGDWPGTELSKGDDGVYALTFTATEAPAFIIFNDGNSGEGHQTDNLVFENGKAYEYIVEIPEPITPAFADGTYYLMNASTGKLVAARGLDKEGTALTFAFEENAGYTITGSELFADKKWVAEGDTYYTFSTVIDGVKKFAAVNTAEEFALIEDGTADAAVWVLLTPDYWENEALSYNVAGTADLCGVEWDTFANKMTKNAETGLFEWTAKNIAVSYNVKPEFKIAVNNVADEENKETVAWYPEGDNWIINPDVTQGEGIFDITITFNNVTKEIGVTAVKAEEPVEPLYALQEGDTFASGETVEVKNAEGEVVAYITYGEAGEDYAAFNAAVADGSVAGYTAYTAGNGVNGNKPGGTFYTIKPVYDGTISVAVVLNNGKAFYIEEDGTALADYNGITVDKKYYGTYEFEAKAGKSYKFYCAGSKLGFYGFDYTFTKTEPITPAFADGIYYMMNSSTGKLVAANGLDKEGAALTFTFDETNGTYTITGSDLLANMQWTAVGQRYFTFYTVIDGVKKFAAVDAAENFAMIEDGTADAAVWVLLTPDYWENEVLSYNVAGTADLCGEAWDVNANKMSKNVETGLYVKTFENITVTNDINPEFKIAVNNTVDEKTVAWYPSGDNWVITPNVTGGEGIFMISIAFNNVTKEISVTAEKTGDILVINSMDIVGDFLGLEPTDEDQRPNWNPANGWAMTQSTENPAVWTLKVEGFQAEAKKYEYKAIANDNWTDYVLPSSDNADFTFGTDEYPAGKYDLQFTVNTEKNTLTLLPVLREVEVVILDEETTMDEGQKVEIDEPFTSHTITVEDGQIITIDAHEVENGARQRGARALDASDITIMYKPTDSSAWTDAGVTVEPTETGYQFEVKGEMAEAINARGFAIEANKPIVVTEIAVVTEVPEPVYYAVGVTDLWGTAWTIDESNKLTLNDEGKYAITKNDLTLNAATNYGYKVVKVVGETQTWIPDGSGNEKNLTVDERAVYSVTLTLDPVEPITVDSYLAVATKTGEAGPEPDAIYTVAGAFYYGNPATEVLVFGGDKAWDAENTEGDMTKDTETGLFTWTKENVELEIGTLTFKVIKNRNWSTAYPADNYNLSVSEAGKYDLVITFNEETFEVNAVATPKFTPTDDTYTVAGSFYYGDSATEVLIFGTSWDVTNTANDMEKQDDGTYKKEYSYEELTAGTIEFKVAKNHSWDYNYGWAGSGHGEYNDNAYYEILSTLTDVTVTITFNPNGETDYDKVQINVTGTATGINGVKAAALKDAQIYNLKGQRVDKAQKGLYIINGKKVVLK